ncbi:MAG: energy transducer TonB, partial [Proteobacteria bacterium]|nr:energy transducer TonB [Pseudomonadota bacterium]
SAGAPTMGPIEVPVITNPRYREPPRPAIYSRRAVVLQQEGTAVIRVLIAPDGTSRDVTLWHATGIALLDQAALQAARGWAFEPALRDGTAIEAWVEIPVRFQLNG